MYVRHNSRFSADSQQSLNRFSADSQQSQQILSIFCCCRWHRQNCLKVPQWKFVSSMSLIAANSRQILVRFLSDSRQILISVLSDSRQILVTMVVFKTIVTYINSPLPWRLKAFSVLFLPESETNTNKNVLCYYLLTYLSNMFVSSCVFGFLELQSILKTFPH